MHSLLIQLLIARIDRDFSPEEYQQLLDEADKELGFAGMLPFYEIHNRIRQEYDAMLVKFRHSKRILHRNVVKQVLGEKATPVPQEDFSKRSTWTGIGDVIVEAYEQQQQDETPVDWQPREPLKAKMDFS